jgi:hypothetical protein
MTRSMTPPEKTRFKGYFPSLDVDKAVVSDEMTAVYNCISWTVGVTDRWLWPGDSIAAFDTFYKGYGFARTADGPIAAWGQSTSNMTHGSISGSGHGLRWESKCGKDLRIQHGLDELEGASYGRVVAFYRSSSALKAPYKTQRTKMKRPTRTYLSAAQRRLLERELEAIPAHVRKTFGDLFAAWKKTWFRGGLAINSNPHTRALGLEYDALIALGPAILPLLVEQLANPDNFLALQLYDAMQHNPRLVVHFEADDDRVLEGEQGRAARVIQAWFQNR